MALIPFPKGSGAKNATGFSASRIVNCYVEASEGSGRTEYMVHSFPGLRQFGVAGGGGYGRGIYAFNDAIYAVVGEQLYFVGSGGGMVALGRVAGSGPVIFDDSGIQLKIVTDEGKSYVYTVGGGLSDVTAAQGGRVSNSTTFFAGRFMDAQKGSVVTFLSELEDSGGGGVYPATAWRASQFLRGETVRAITVGSNVWCFSQTSYELQGLGDSAADYPFAVQPGTGVTGIGLGARHSAVVGPSNLLIWAGHNRIVYVADGYTARRISTRFAESVLWDCSTIADAEGFIVNGINGHIFYVLTLPSGGRTLVYDLTEDVWTEVETRGQALWRGRGCAFAFGKHILCDRYSNTLYELTDSVHTDAGQQVQRTIVMDYFYLQDAASSHGVMQVLCETGQSTDSVLSIDWSDDGGNTWSVERSHSLGPLSWRGAVTEHGLGHAPFAGRVYRFKHFGDGAFSLFGANISNIEARRP